MVLPARGCLPFLALGIMILKSAASALKPSGVWVSRFVGTATASAPWFVAAVAAPFLPSLPFPIA